MSDPYSQQGRMTAEQIARVTQEHGIAPLDTVTVSELAQALTEYHVYLGLSWPASPALPPVAMARKLVKLIAATRAGVDCLGCKMGEHPD